MAEKIETIQVRTRASLKRKLEKKAEDKGAKLTRYIWIALAEKAERDGDKELHDEIIAQM